MSHDGVGVEGHRPVFFPFSPFPAIQSEQHRDETLNHIYSLWMIQVILYKVNNCRPLAILTIDPIKVWAQAGNISDQPDRHRPAARQHPSNHSKHCISRLSVCVPYTVSSLLSCLLFLLSSHITTYPAPWQHPTTIVFSNKLLPFPSSSRLLVALGPTITQSTSRNVICGMHVGIFHI